MIRLDEGTLRRTRALIERYGIHDDATSALPVPIKQVARNEGWTINYRSSMGSAIAMAFCIGPVKLMYVNENLTEPVQRVGIAHEMAHILCQHRLSMDTKMQIGHEHEGLRQANQVQEKQAELVGAMLLIPEGLALSPFSDKEVTLMCQVSTWCIATYRSAAQTGLSALLLTG